MGKNGYLERQKNTVNVYRQAEKETYIQFMTDTLMVTLNDPKVMGRDVFGEKRIVKIVDAWGEMYDLYHGALEAGPEADYIQEKLDCRLKPIAGKRFLPFAERYKWIKAVSYGLKKK